MIRSEDAARAISRREGRGSALLWFGVLGAPLAWALQLVVDYSLEEWFACSPSALQAGEVAGTDVRGIALVVSVLLAAVALAAGLVALRCYVRLRNGASDGSGARARWMAVAGIMNSILYLVIILASLAPPLMLRVCESSP